MSVELQLATDWRAQKGYVGRGGVVVVFRNEVAGWCDTLRDPGNWIAGCIAVAEDGRHWIAIAGDEQNGAMMWLAIGDPDQSTGVAP